MGNCCNCGFRDFYVLKEFEVSVKEANPEKVAKEDEKVKLRLVLCKVCGNVYVENWRELWE